MGYGMRKGVNQQQFVPLLQTNQRGASNIWACVAENARARQEHQARMNRVLLAAVVRKDMMASDLQVFLTPLFGVLLVTSGLLFASSVLSKSVALSLGQVTCSSSTGKPHFHPLMAIVRL